MSSTNGTQPDDEMAVLGALLLQPELAAEFAEQLNGTDFAQPRHETIWRAIYAVVDEGHKADPLMVVDRLRRTGELQRVGGVYVFELMHVCPNPAQIYEYATHVRGAAQLRAIGTLGVRFNQIAASGDVTEPDLAVAQAMDTLDEIVTRTTHTQQVTVRNVRQFLTETENTHDWLVPDVLERQDRVVLTGGEGSGKSTLGRQMAVQTAAGVHPFTTDEINPLRVLILDFENSEPQMRRAVGKLYGNVAQRMDPDRLRIESRIAGVNLLDRGDKDWMQRVVDAANPDLLITGPAYKMTEGDTDKEKESKPVALFLDKLRDDHGCAVWLEAHVGNETPGTKRRPIRPFGWSGWRRWPEFGLYLGDDGDLVHWRGDRDQRVWPEALMRGSEWPWSVARKDSEKTWMAIRECIMAAGEMLSNREVAKRTGLNRSMVDRTIHSFSQHYAGLKYALESE